MASVQQELVSIQYLSVANNVVHAHLLREHKQVSFSCMLLERVSCYNGVHSAWCNACFPFAFGLYLTAWGTESVPDTPSKTVN